MRVLWFISDDRQVEIQLSTAGIATPWKRFKGRVGDAADTYCDYTSSLIGMLNIANADGKTECVEPKEEELKTEWLSCWPVVYETCRYNVVIKFKNIEGTPCVVHPIKEIAEQFAYIELANGESLLTGELDFLNEPGEFHLTFKYRPLGGNERTEVFKFRVVSPKLDAKNDYKTILSLVREEYNDLVFKYLTKTFQNLSRSNKKEENLLIWYSIFKEVIEGYLKAIHFIINKPHLKTKREVYYSRADRIKRWSPQMCELFKEKEKEEVLDSYHFRHELTETSTNTRENRFVKFTLERISSKLGDILEKIVGLYDDETSEQEKKYLRDQRLLLKRITRNPLFRNLQGEPLRNESIVLQKRTGYAQVYRYWLMLQSGVTLLEGSTSIGVRQIWEIYELWCFLKVKQLICEILNIDRKNHEEYCKYVKENKSSMFDPFAEGELEHQIILTRPDIIGLDEVELLYQHTYNRTSGEVHTATTINRPDIVLNIKKPNGFMLTYLFDAKYRVLDDDKLNKEDVDNEIKRLGVEGADYPPSDAINQMHRYRDAIYYGLNKEQRQQHTAKEIIGGYILFPGRGDDKAIKERYFFKSIESVNIGAFPLLPDAQHPENEGKLLREFLERVIKDQSLYEQIKDSVPQRGLYYTRKDLSNKLVYIGYVKADNPEIALFKENKAKTYYSGNIDFNEVDIQSLEYLLPIVAGNVQGVYEIESIGFRKLSKIRPLKSGEEDNIRVVFSLGDFIPLIDTAISCKNRIHNNEVKAFNEVDAFLVSLKEE